MAEHGCAKGEACKPDNGKYQALEIALAPGGLATKKAADE